MSQKLPILVPRSARRIISSQREETAADHPSAAIFALTFLTSRYSTADEPRANTERPHITIRGVYGGVPQQIFDRGETLDDYGINAIWIGSGSVTRELVDELKSRSKTLKIFVEFNTMHEAGYLKDHPDATPDRCRRPSLAAARRLAGRLPDPSRLSPRPDGSVSPGLDSRTDRRHLARLSPCARKLGAGPARPAGHLFL